MPNPDQAKKLLLLRIDAIGDYLLFRNFLSVIRTAYRNHRITLLGNVIWRDLAETYDASFVDDFIWLDRQRFSESRWYRWRTYMRLNRFDELVNPTYSRKFFFEDDLVRRSGATIRIGSRSDESNASREQNWQASKYYSQLIETGKEPLFEFDRNRRFIEEWLQISIQLHGPSLPVARKKATLPYVVIFPGASEPHKQWSSANFAEVCRQLLRHYASETWLCGGENDRMVARDILQRVAHARLIDKTGQTTLTQLAELIANAQLLLTNDTSALHLGAATGTRTICLYKGDHFGRFQPYPEYYSSWVKTIMPPDLEAELSYPALLAARAQQRSFIDINTISIDQVWEAVQKWMV